ncbi:diguanylate cyclase (GGDEF)-like protein/PAS domain S-box-containing protein [Azospirillum fermentarium]|uniref:GGDEF domain-containing protein n=1 Tax=Azospirillum fermentarium TaxID=1233114 RepID=UPI00222656B7|nr:sensor domain-containing diguanylate cyclase [Azospirillum fermentarium]MCW2245870.1 diguanylate cyclase (GGDEF)-like protein/PAS domain S-box-containing protein [Azospirillum fermentarium]
MLSAILNSLFFISDWRFQGTEHFFVAVPARGVVVAVALVCLILIGRAGSMAAAQRVMGLWQAGTAVPVAFLVSSHSDLAFLVVFMLPAIFYLAVPAPFRQTVAGGAGCSALMLAGYLLPVPLPPTVTGLVLGMVMLNAALLLTVVRSNRLRRLEWAAAEAERRTKEELAASRAMLETMFMAAPLPLVVTARADGAILRANQAAYRFFGGDPAALGIETMAEIYSDPLQRGALLKEMERCGRVDGFEARVRLAGGDLRDVLIAASPIVVNGEEQLMAGVVDITSRKEMEAHLERLATTDPLTGLANRYRFFGVAEQEITRAARYDRPLAVLMADLDHFKRINDTCGHEAGDYVLTAFAALCRQILRPSDQIARFGGEEFALLLPETGLPGAVALAERLRAATETLSVPDGRLRASTSIGVTVVHPGESSVDTALSRADRALYAAKQGGRNRVCVSDEDAVAETAGE